MGQNLQIVYDAQDVLAIQIKNEVTLDQPQEPDRLIKVVLDPLVLLGQLDEKITLHERSVEHPDADIVPGRENLGILVELTVERDFGFYDLRDVDQHDDIRSADRDERFAVEQALFGVRAQILRFQYS